MFTATKEKCIITEESQCNPSTIYGRVKCETVEFLNSVRYESNLRCHSLILFNQESPLRKQGFLFNDLANKLSECLITKRNVIEVQNKYYSADWSDARDLPALFEQLFSNSYYQNLVVSSGIACTIEELVYRSWGLLCREFDLAPIQVKTKQNSISPVLVGDSSKALSIGWNGSRAIEKTLVDFVKQNRFGKSC